MARKGVAVSQIILLVLGILVLAVVAYLLYTNFVTTGSTISAETCRAEATRACTGCQIAAGITTATDCKFDKENLVTKAKTSLARCEEQGNLKITKTGFVDCTQYTGSGTGGGVTPTTPPTVTPPAATPAAGTGQPCLGVPLPTSGCSIPNFWKCEASGWVC